MLGSSVRRSAAGQYSSRGSSALKRRMVVGLLVLLALVLITVSFRESAAGPLHEAQGAAAAALRPAQVAVERVVRPFRDAWSWTAGLLRARSEVERLRAENEQLLQQVIANESALKDNVTLRRLLEYQASPEFPQDFRGVTAEVLAKPPSAFDQSIVVAAGAEDGVRLHAPVVTADGLVGQVAFVTASAARVTLLIDEESAVSARDLASGADGLVRRGQGAGQSLMLDRVPKSAFVRKDDVVVTSGWRSGPLSSLYPKNIPIGRVTRVGQTDADLYKQVQIEPFVDFSSLGAVVVLVSKKPAPELP